MFLFAGHNFQSKHYCLHLLVFRKKISIMDRRIPISNQTIASGNASLRVAWGVGNSLVAFSAPTNTRKNTESNTGIAKRGQLHSVAFEQSLYTPIFRKLVNESAQTFLSLQKIALEEESK